MNVLTVASDGHAFEAIVARGCTFWAIVARTDHYGLVLGRPERPAQMSD